MEQIVQEFDRGVVSPSHPPIIGTAQMTATAAALKAGTVLKLVSGAYTACADTDTPDTVLVEDVDAHSGTVVNALVLFHGLVISSRLLNASQTEATDTLKNKLSDTGIYLTQAGWSESNYA